MEKRPNTKLTLDQGLAITRDLQPDCSSSALADILGVKRAFLLRRSVDARHKGDVHFVATVGICGDDGGAPCAVVPLDQRPLPTRVLEKTRPVVVGMGPAGLFAALDLAEAGRCPLVIERGAPVDERMVDIERYHRTRILDTQSNVQFGEGGAGTYSDGKLTTGKNSPAIARVLETFVAAGAPPEILWQAKPHIGTDVLGGVVKCIRERIVSCGGEVRFHTQLIGISLNESGELAAIDLSCKGARETISASQLVLACGHSARDTFGLLESAGFELVPKPFSIGVRIEHEQCFIDDAQYGAAAGHPALGAADYKLSCHLKGGRSVYSFCMCPGGEVVAASSEQDCLCVNGMSKQARAGSNANAALLCNVVAEDFPHAHDPLSGIAFQRAWERAAFEQGGSSWHAPAQRLGAFMQMSATGAKTWPEASYPLGVTEADLGACLPEFAADALRQAIPLLDRRLHGFADPGALLTGIEARSSSPVRIVRDAQTLMATRAQGVYPCGEGAGYAGGIMSAALDGLRVAASLVRS